MNYSEFFHYRFTYPKNSKINSKINKVEQKLVHPFEATYQPKQSSFRLFNMEMFTGFIHRNINPTLGYFIKVFPVIKNDLITYELWFKELKYRHISTGKQGYIEFNASQYVPIQEEDLIDLSSIRKGDFEIISNVSHPNYNVSPFVSGKLKGVYFEAQPDIGFEDNKLFYKGFDTCFLSRDQYTYLMNNIMNVESRNGYLFISGARIEPKEIITLRQEDSHFNSEEGYFTLKFEAILEDENDELNKDPLELSSQNTPAPIITLANPCPPIWNPTISNRHIINLDGESNINRWLGIFYRHCILGDVTADESIS